MAQTIKPPTPPSPLILAEPDTSPGPFEGPEKLLEVWFAPSVEALSQASVANGHSNVGDGTASSGSALVHGSSNTKNPSRRDGLSGTGQPFLGLRTVPRAVWEDMLDIVKCKVLSVVEGDELDAYLLSESSLFVAPHVIILKTCGTTLNLLGLHRILEIAHEYCGFEHVFRCFYSRKSFFFPERQLGPHRDWAAEVKFLDGVFGETGSAYTVGPINRDHWLLYLTGANPGVPIAPAPLERPLALPLSGVPECDQTLEILMSHLSPAGREPFFIPDGAAPRSGHELGTQISADLGIDALFDKSETTLDSFGFEPCGYSANAVIGSGMPATDGGYFTIHVTPEEGWSYASFECNVPLPVKKPTGHGNGCLVNGNGKSHANRPDLHTLIRQVVDIFQPNRLSITLFVSTGDQCAAAMPGASTAFVADVLPEFERKDRIGYEFDGYDLVFGCFERKGWVESKATSPTTSTTGSIAGSIGALGSIKAIQ